MYSSNATVVHSLKRVFFIFNYRKSEYLTQNITILIQCTITKKTKTWDNLFFNSVYRYYSFFSLLFNQQTISLELTTQPLKFDNRFLREARAGARASKAADDSTRVRNQWMCVCARALGFWDLLFSIHFFSEWTERGEEVSTNVD